MYRLTIRREYLAYGTIGTMSYQDKEICKCIEPRRTDDLTALSCIPEGEYPALIRETELLGLHLWIADVPVRGHILVNSVENTRRVFQRNIIPVMSFSDKGVGIRSKEALDKLMGVLLPDLLKSRPVKLFITSKRVDNEIKAFGKHQHYAGAFYAQPR